MISISLSSKSIFENVADSYAFFLEEDFIWSPELDAIAKSYFPSLQALFKERHFTGKQNSACVIPVSKDDKFLHLIFVGLGKKNKQSVLDIEYYRRAVGRIVRAVEGHKVNSVALYLPEASLYGVSEDYLAQHTATILHMANYHFDDFKKEKLSEKKIEVIIGTHGLDEKKIKAGIERGGIVAAAVNRTRHWVDTPPSRLTPTILADSAEKVAQKYNVAIKVFGEHEIIQMGMGGLAAVSAGSHQDAKFIIMEYKTSAKDAPTLAFVGKGITFDSGGLSIKPANSMETMKEDMAGAAAVINAIGALAQLKAPVNIIAIAPTTENLPSGTATKPGDIIQFYNGKTAEVRNTDAEGRLILADALSYAIKHYNPDFIIDVATLTGAADYACGPFYTAMLTQSDEHAVKVEQASKTSGDRVWRLPMHDDYAAAVTSEVADICNIGKPAYKAGTITAAFFLKQFVNDTPWVHLDIAPVAFDMPAMSYYESGATGAAVRLLIDLALQWK